MMSCKIPTLYTLQNNYHGIQNHEITVNPNFLKIVFTTFASPVKGDGNSNFIDSDLHEFIVGAQTGKGELFI